MFRRGRISGRRTPPPGDAGRTQLGHRGHRLEPPLSFCHPIRDQQGKARWDGAGRGLSFELAREIQCLILSDYVSPRWTRRAVAQVAEAR